MMYETRNIEKWKGLNQIRVAKAIRHPTERQIVRRFTRPTRSLHLDPELQTVQRKTNIIKKWRLR